MDIARVQARGPVKSLLSELTIAQRSLRCRVEGMSEYPRSFSRLRVDSRRERSEQSELMQLRVNCSRGKQLQLAHFHVVVAHPLYPLYMAVPHPSFCCRCAPTAGYCYYSSMLLLLHLIQLLLLRQLLQLRVQPRSLHCRVRGEYDERLAELHRKADDSAQSACQWNTRSKDFSKIVKVLSLLSLSLPLLLSVPVCLFAAVI